MNPQVLVTTIGFDRPGIVEEVAGWIASKGGNIEDSRMARLGGEFATLILVSGPDNLATQLEETRVAFENESRLTVFLRTVSSVGGTGETTLRYTLRATSLDHTGIVHQVAGVLRSQGINIVSAETRRSSAPFTGTPVFNLHMEIDIPTRLPVARLRAQLVEFGERESIDVALTAQS